MELVPGTERGAFKGNRYGGSSSKLRLARLCVERGQETVFKEQREELDLGFRVRMEMGL